MRIINAEKLNGHEVIVLTGRDNHVRKIAKELKVRLYYCPRVEDHFTDYPAIVSELEETLKYEDKPVAVTTQSAEFLDCLLRSGIEFVLATVRHYDHDDDGTYRLRVVPKEEAREDRERYSMEFRV